MRIAAIGDVHRQWTERDCRILDGMGYDLVLFVGDLGDRLHLHTLATARRIARLRTPALLIPGNHDATTPLGVLFEGLHRWTARPALARRSRRRTEALQRALGPVQLAGYSAHPHPAHGVTVIAARPHAMDGRRLSFAPALQRHGVASAGGLRRAALALGRRRGGTIVFLRPQRAERARHGAPWRRQRRSTSATPTWPTPWPGRRARARRGRGGAGAHAPPRPATASGAWSGTASRRLRVFPNAAPTSRSPWTPAPGSREADGRDQASRQRCHQAHLARGRAQRSPH
ncbi:MAG: metallophosphoesterase [Myxococcota bacterium]